MVSNPFETGPSRRAIRPEQKAERHGRLLEAGRRLFDERPLERIGVADIASQAGVAKGTFYLYFDTKEALFLALAREQLAAWFDAVDTRLQAAESQPEADKVLHAVVEALRVRPILPRLLAVLHTVLEHNIDVPTARDFKFWLRARSLRTAALLEAELDCLAPGEGVLLILRMHAMVIGFQHAAFPAPVVREVIESEPDLALFDVDFLESFATALRALLAGWCGQS